MSRRVVTAIILLGPLVLGFALESLRWLPLVILAAIAVACVFEITAIQRRKGIRVYRRVAGWGVLALVLEGMITGMEYSVYIFGICVCLAWLVRLFKQVEGAWEDVSATVFTLAYVGLPMAALAAIFLTGYEARAWLLFTLAIVWLTDSCALIVGKKYGSVKMAPRISPGKTWEGSLGGFAGAMVSALGARLFAPGVFAGVSNIELVLYCLAFSVISQLGDLAESLLKRDAGVKDSGGELTGHGGFLDIMDAVLYVSLPMIFYLKLAHPEVLAGMGKWLG